MDINELTTDLRNCFLDDKKERFEKKRRFDAERVRDMEHLRFVEKWTLKEIGNKYKISRERVRQILGNSGSGYKGMRQSKKIVAHPELTNKELAEKIGCAEGTISKYRGFQRHATDHNEWCKKGAEIEDAVSAILNQRGIEHKLMGHKHPFDIMLTNGKRIDVKSCFSILSPKSQHQEYYSFGIEKYRRGNYADFFILVCPLGYFVVPNEIIPDQLSQIRISAAPKKKSKYYDCKDRFDFLQ